MTVPERWEVHRGIVQYSLLVEEYRLPILSTAGRNQRERGMDALKVTRMAPVIIIIPRTGLNLHKILHLPGIRKVSRR